MYPTGTISTLKSAFNLFKQPYKVGDTLQVKDTTVVIIGIQRFHYDVLKKCLHVIYFVQSLNISYNFKKVQQHTNNIYPAWFVFRMDKLNEHKFETHLQPIQLNDLLWIDKLGAHVKVVDFTSIEFVGTDLKIWTNVQPIYPIDPAKAKELYKKERLKAFELIKNEK